MARKPAPEPEPPRTVGRPSLYTEELGNEIIAAIEEGEKSLRQLCEDHPEWPSRGTILRWAHSDDTQGGTVDFAAKYARAKLLQQEAFAEDNVYIADTEEDDGKARNRILARQWYSAKLNPKRFGDRTQMDVAATVKHELPTIADVEAAKKAILDKL